MPSLIASISSNGADALTLTQADLAPGASLPVSYEWLITDSAGMAYGRAFSESDIPLSVNALPAGSYASRVTAVDADNASYASRPFSFTLSGPAVTCDLALTNLVTTRPATTGGLGYLDFIASTTHGPVQVVVTAVPGNQYVTSQAVPGDGTVQRLSIGPGDYLLSATDQASCSTSQLFAIGDYAVPPVLGCTDPNATNYDPNATQDNGSCEYAPVVRVPYFDVPKMQSLRFVQPLRTDLPAFDNTLLAAETPLDYTIDGYCQKVEKADRLTIQVLSNYEGAPVLRVRESATQNIALVAPATQVLQGGGQVATFEVYILPDPIAGFSRVYFNADDLPLPFVAGQRITIETTGTSLDGTYPIHDVLEDAAAASPFLRITATYPAGQLRVDGTLTTTYLIQGYNTWQVVVSFSGIAPGCYYAEITAADPDFGTDALAISEPIDVAVKHPDTVLVQWRNFDNGFGLNYSYGIAHRLRLDGRFYERRDTSEKTVLRNDDSRLVMLSASAYGKALFEVLLQPYYVHSKLNVVLCQDFTKVDGVEVIGEGEYASEPVQRYNLSRGTIVLELVNFLGAGNRDDLGDVDKGGGRFLLANQKFLQVNP